MGVLHKAEDTSPPRRLVVFEFLPAYLIGTIRCS